jgi:hypothetical protein
MSRFPVAAGLEWAREAGFLSRRIENPPGQPALAYRLGTWLDFLYGMLPCLRVAHPPGRQQEGVRPPLARLNTASGDDWITNLAGAWAVVGDVLTFYTERIANEGFLGTAREEASVRELVALLGYRPQLGAAAATALSFTVADVKGMPRRVVVPRGARIQSLPAEGKRPQSFETVKAFTAQAEWNALLPRLHATAVEQVLSGAATELLLDGSALGRLKAGDGLLLLARLAAEEAGSGEGEERQYFRIIRKVETPRAWRLPQPATRVSWLGALEPGDPEVRLRGVQAFVLRKTAGLFGRNAPPWEAEPSAVKQRYQPSAGGLLLGAPPWTDWQALGELLPPQPPNVLAAAPAGQLAAAAVPGKGAYLSTDGGKSWQQASQVLVRKQLRSLLIDGRGYVFAGTADGMVLRSVDRGATWEVLAGSVVMRKGKRWQRTDTRLPRTAVRCLAALPAADGVRLLAGTDQGAFRSLGESSGWEPASDGLPNVNPDTGLADVPVNAFAAVSGMPGVLFAGTARGVFRSANYGASWTAANAGLPGTDPKTGASETVVAALAAMTDQRSRTTRLLAGTAHGVLRSTDLGGSWQPANVGLPGTDPATGLSLTAVGCLASHYDARNLATYLFAGTPAGLFISGDGGDAWAPVGGPAADGAVLALAIAAAGTLLASTPARGGGGDEWPGFAIRGGEVDLDAVYPAIVSGSWLVLWQAREREGPLLAIAPILRVATVERQDFTIDRVVTRLEVDAGNLSELNLRTTRAFMQSEPLALFVEQLVVPRPLAADRVELARPLAVRLGERRPVFVTGKNLRAAFAAGAKLVPEAPGAPPRDLAPGEEVRVCGFLPATPPARQALRVVAPGGVAGTVAVAPADIEWRAAAPGDPVTAELAEAEDAAGPPDGDQPESSWLLFEPPLTGCFDPLTVKVLANVAPATQGATVAREVLGSGDGSRTNQRFTLSQPITYLPAASPAGTASTLEVRVNDLLYREVPSLDQAASYDQAYMVRQDRQGRPTVIFGDGKHGARLPHGRENVVASYRSGIWDAPLAAGQLMILHTRPLGLRAAINPLPVPPGALPEACAETRIRAPLAVRTLDRVVSATDYEDFARSFPGIARARARPLWTGSAHLMQITVAAAGGRELADGDPLLLALEGALRGARAAAAPLVLASYLPVDLGASLALLVDRRYRPTEVAAAAGQALAASFGFATSSFGQTLVSAAVKAVAEAVPGVVAAHLESFGPVFVPAGEVPPPAVERRVQAREARYDRRNGCLRPAELLRLAPAAINVTAEAAP